jgi:outer membrane receptor protein involved in Fe transport
MNNHTSHPSRVANASVLSALIAILAATPGFAQTSDAPKPEDTVKLQQFEVTGSRIRRVDAETPSPVVRITQESLQATGFSTVDDALRAMPFNTGASITGVSSSTGFASGTSTVNLRGLGNNNTLVLINGRRAAPSGAGTFNGFQTVVDLRQIPTSAVEAIEIVKDGASAIYGSDAVAGVLNIKLKRDYTGLGVDVSIGNTFGNDSLETSAFIIAGARTGKTSITAMADIYKRNAIADRDYSWSRTADLRNDRAGTGQVETSTEGATADGTILGTVTGIDWRSSSTFPARFFVPGTATIRSFLNPTTDPQAANAVAVNRATGAGLYDFQQDTLLLGEENRFGFQLYLNHDFTDKISGFADLFYRRITGINNAAPSPFTTTDKGAGTNGRLLVPADNPYNPYGNRYFGTAGQAIELSTYRLVNAGPRVSDTASDYPRLLVGLKGDLPNDWAWQTSAMYAQGSFYNSSPGTAFDSRVQEALNGVIINGVKLYANPFGPEDPRLTDYYSGANPTKTTFTSNIYELSANGSLFELPAGQLGVAVGTEFRKESITDIRTLENENGNVVGGSEGFGYTGKRNVTSAYAELSVPILAKTSPVGALEAQLAARYEDYSDFGTTTKPKVALAYRPNKWLMLRTSFSESFRAPDLQYLYSAGSVSFTSGAVFDPRRPDQPSAQIKTLGKGNPELQPEETKTYSVSTVIEVPVGPLKGLVLEAGYFKFDQSSLITRDSANFTLTNELTLPAGRVVRKPLTPAEAALGYTVGIIDYVSTDWYNSSKQVYEGYDFELSYQWKTARFGTFRGSAAATYIAKFERTNFSPLTGAASVTDLDGTDGSALWRGNVRVGWNKGDWAASVFVNCLGEMPSSTIVTGYLTPKQDMQILVNPQVSYAGLWNTRITVGVRNVFDEAPPRYLPASQGYNAGIAIIDPRFWYVRLSREF